ncbi:putative transcription factor B3-Domain family [Helianthus anomalus]
MDGWMNVIKDMQLKFGYILVFDIIQNPKLTMTVFHPGGSEFIIPKKEPVEQKEAHTHNQGCHNKTPSFTADNNTFEKTATEKFVRYPIQFLTIITVHLYALNSNQLFHILTLFIIPLEKHFIPDEVIKKKKIAQTRTLIIKNQEGSCYNLGVKIHSRRARKEYLVNEWLEFMAESDISFGDKCTFKILEDEGMILLSNVCRLN